MTYADYLVYTSSMADTKHTTVRFDEADKKLLRALVVDRFLRNLPHSNSDVLREGMKALAAKRKIEIPE